MVGTRRKRPRLQGHTGDDSVGDQIEWVRTDNGIITPRPSGRVERRKKGIPEAVEAADNLYALNTLQQRQNSPCNDSILKYSLESMMSYLPTEVFNNIYIGEVPGEEEDFSDSVSDATFEANLESRWPEMCDMFNYTKQSPYLFWPINAGGGNYVTLIMVLGRNDNKMSERIKLLADPRRIHSEELKKPVSWDEVVQWSVVDPKRGFFDVHGREHDQIGKDQHTARVERVCARVRRILGRGGIKWIDETEYMQSLEEPRCSFPWVPPQTDDWSSGFRSFALIKKQCEAVLEHHCAEEVWKDDIFWQRASGWLSPHAIRHEMMGLLAIGCIRDMQWRARIAIEPVHELDGIENQSAFAARLLRPTTEVTAYFPPVYWDSPDTMRPSKGASYHQYEKKEFILAKLGNPAKTKRLDS